MMTPASRTCFSGAPEASVSLALGTTCTSPSGPYRSAARNKKILPGRAERGPPPSCRDKRPGRLAGSAGPRPAVVFVWHEQS